MLPWSLERRGRADSGIGKLGRHLGPSIGRGLIKTRQKWRNLYLILNKARPMTLCLVAKLLSLTSTHIRRPLWMLLTVMKT